MVTADRGRSLGFGFVVFFDKEAADEAVKQSDGTKWWGRNIVVQHFDLGHHKVSTIHAIGVARAASYTHVIY